MNFISVRVLALASGLAFFQAAFADVPAVKGSRLTVRPTIDGTIDPAEWGSLPVLTGFIDPYTSKPVKEQSEVRIGYDDIAIYVAFRAYDSEPQNMIGREITPNSEFKSEDTFKIALNPFHNRSENGLSSFVVNLLGTQTEYISGGRANKREWRGEWGAATKRLSDGWSCEMRIPWKILSFPASKTIDLDLNFVRYQGRTRIESKWADTTPNVRMELMGVWQGVEPPTARPKAKIESLAYVAPGFDEKNPTLNAGLDLRYKFDQQLTGLVSISPDFKNIEGQVAGIDFTRTERYLDDTRPFFTEGSDFFRLTGQFGFGRMFYSRRIENFDIGAKYFGQINSDLKIGALVTQSSGKETSGVLRFGKELNPKASVDVYGTFHESDGIQSNTIGLNHVNTLGNYGYGMQLASETKSNGSTNTAGTVDLSYSVPRLFSTVRYTWIEPTFSPELAYVPFTDRRGVYNYTNYSTQYRVGPFRSVDANLFTTYYEHYNGDVMQLGSESFISATTRGDTELRLGRTFSTFDGSVDNLYSFGTTFNNSNRFRRLELGLDQGTRGGIRSTFYNVGGSLRVLKKLDLALSFSEFKFDGTDQQTILGATYQIGATRSVSGRAVFHGDKTNAYVAYRNSGGKGTELFVILGDPNSEESRARVSVKMVWAF